MSHTMWIPGKEDEPKLNIVGNSDFSGDFIVQWLEGDVEGHEAFKSLVIPGEVLQRIAKFLNKKELEERLIKFLEEI